MKDMFLSGKKNEKNRVSQKKIDKGQGKTGCSVQPYYTFITHSSGWIWGKGDNSLGQLGLNDTQDRSRFSRITTLDYNPIREIVCADGFATFFISTQGEVYFSGSNVTGYAALGHNEIVTSPTLIKGISHRKISKIYTDGYRAFFVDIRGHVYAAGQNIGGMLGVNTTESINTSKKIKFPIESVAIKEILLTKHMTIFISKEGKTFAAGMDKKRELFEKSFKSNKPVLIAPMPVDIKDISCKSIVVTRHPEGYRMHVCLPPQQENMKKEDDLTSIEINAVL